MTPEREAQMREMFEKWARQKMFPMHFNVWGEYSSYITQIAYLSFLACARSLEPMIKDGDRYRFLRDVENPLCIYLYKTSIDAGSTVADIGEVIASRDADNVVDAAMSAALERKNATD